MGPARLDVSPDSELSLAALPALSRDDCATDGVVIFFGRPAVLRFLFRPLPLEPMSPDIARVHCALLLPSPLLPPPLSMSPDIARVHCALLLPSPLLWDEEVVKMLQIT